MEEYVKVQITGSVKTNKGFLDGVVTLGKGEADRLVDLEVAEYVTKETLNNDIESVSEKNTIPEIKAFLNEKKIEIPKEAKNKKDLMILVTDFKNSTKA